MGKGIADEPGRPPDLVGRAPARGGGGIGSCRGRTRGLFTLLRGKGIWKVRFRREGGEPDQTLNAGEQTEGRWRGGGGGRGARATGPEEGP